MRTYDPSQVSIIFGAISISGGFAEGTFINVEPAGPSYTTKVGASGEVTRTKMNNQTATATLTLLQSAAANGLLSAQHIIDINTKGGLGVVPFLLKDNSGTTLLAAAEAWIEQAPNASFGTDLEDREWKIGLGTTVAFHGGNLD